MDDKVLCAAIRLRGALARLGMVLDHRNDRNYAIAFRAAKDALADFDAIVAPVTIESPAP